MNKRISKMKISYTKAKECKNPLTFYVCRQCGKCGRKFKEGVMSDTGGTHNYDYK